MGTVRAAGGSPTALIPTCNMAAPFGTTVRRTHPLQDGNEQLADARMDLSDVDPDSVSSLQGLGAANRNNEATNYL